MSRAGDLASEIISLNRQVVALRETIIPLPSWFEDFTTMAFSLADVSAQALGYDDHVALLHYWNDCGVSTCKNKTCESAMLGYSYDAPAE